LPSSHQLPHTHHHPSSGASAVGQIVAEVHVPRGLDLTQHQETKQLQQHRRENYVDNPMLN
jgi:hypothetical protein